MYLCEKGSKLKFLESDPVWAHIVYIENLFTQLKDVEDLVLTSSQQVH